MPSVFCSGFAWYYLSRGLENAMFFSCKEHAASCLMMSAAEAFLRPSHKGGKSFLSPCCEPTAGLLFMHCLGEWCGGEKNDGLCIQQSILVLPLNMELVRLLQPNDYFHITGADAFFLKVKINLLIFGIHLFIRDLELLFLFPLR